MTDKDDADAIPDLLRNPLYRLETVARLAFPDATVSRAQLQCRINSGRLTAYKVAGKMFTTLAHVEEMVSLYGVPKPPPPKKLIVKRGRGRPKKVAM